MICCLAAGAAIVAAGGFAAAKRSRDTESQAEEVVDRPVDPLRVNDERCDVELP